MALTFRRWLAIALLACAAIAVWQIPGRGSAGSRLYREFTGTYVPDYGYVRRHGWPDATTRLGAATLHLRLLQIRDSVFTPQVMAGATTGFHVLADRQFPDSLRRFTTTTLEDAWRANAPGARYPVIVALVQDTTKTLGGLPMASGNYTYSEVFPPDSATPICRVLVRMRVDLAARYGKQAKGYVRGLVLHRAPTSAVSTTVLGPCALYATYGPPGPGIVAWLNQAAWSPTRALDPRRPSPVWLDEYQYQFGYMYHLLASPTDFGGVSTVPWMVRERLSNDGIACIAGNDERCVDGLLQPTAAPREDQAWRRDVIDVSANWYGWGMQANGSLGPSVGWIVSDMIRDIGPQQFEAFWRSASPPPAAFEAATHRPLGDWLHQWAVRTYGTDTLGPSIPRRGRLAGLLVVLAGLLVAMGFAHERRLA